MPRPVRRGIGAFASLVSRAPSPPAAEGLPVTIPPGHLTTKTDIVEPVLLALPSQTDRIFPTVTSAQIARVAAHGRGRSRHAGEVLVEAGAPVVPFLAAASGHRASGVLAVDPLTDRS